MQQSDQFAAAGGVLDAGAGEPGAAGTGEADEVDAGGAALKSLDETQFPGLATCGPTPAIVICCV